MRGLTEHLVVVRDVDEPAGRLIADAMSQLPLSAAARADLTRAVRDRHLAGDDDAAAGDGDLADRMAATVEPAAGARPTAPQPQVRTWSTGQVPSAADLDDLVANPWEPVEPPRLRRRGELRLAEATPATLGRILNAAVATIPGPALPTAAGNALVELAAHQRDAVLSLDAAAIVEAGFVRETITRRQAAWLLTRVDLESLLAATQMWLRSDVQLVAEVLLAVASVGPDVPIEGDEDVFVVGGRGTVLDKRFGAPSNPQQQQLSPGAPSPGSPPAAPMSSRGGWLRLPRIRLPGRRGQPKSALPPPPTVAPGGAVPRMAEPPSVAGPGDDAPRMAEPPEMAAPPELAGAEPDMGAPPAMAPPAMAPPAMAPLMPEPERATSRAAWPRIDAPDTVAPAAAFDVVVGLQADKQERVEAPMGPVRLPPGPVDLDVQVMADGFGIVPSAGEEPTLRRRLRVTDDDPFPTTTFTLTALAGAELTAERSIGVVYTVAGATVGMATRSVMVGAEPAAAEVATDRPPTADVHAAPVEALTLPAELLADEHADLTIAIMTGDDPAGQRLTFGAWSTLVDLPPAPTDPRERRYDVGDAPDEFLRQIIRRLEGDDAPEQLLSWLRGRGTIMGDALPSFVEAAIRQVIAAAEQAQRAPTILLLTQDPHVPWELASLREPDGSIWFLGARAAVSRWLFGDPPPSPAPPRTTTVTDAVAVTAVYDGVDGWGRLEQAEQEVADLEGRLGTVTRVAPTFGDFLRCVQGDPPADLLHVALHGQFLPGEARSGLVLLRADPTPGMPPVEDFFEPENVRDGRLQGRAPLVFLNACQVGASGDVLGVAGGLAAAFVYIGAGAVIAPLWNVNDVHARASAAAFYGASAAGHSGPEVLRQRRAAVTDEAVAAHGRAVLTDLAYQFWGAPDHRLALVATVGDAAPTPVPVPAPTEG